MSIAHDIWKRYLKELYHWEDQINKALKRCGNDVTFDDIVSQVRSQSLYFTVNDQQTAFAIWHFVDVAVGKRRLHIFIGGGDYDDLMDLVDEKLVPIAKKYGATRLTAMVRRGFIRRHPDGWHAPCVYAEKEI